ncbi:MAG: sugar kinase [Amphiplicatus sp.]
MTGAIVTIGELMIRLKPPGKLRLRQASELELCHGGAEANVAVSLANFGLSSRFVSALPENELGEQALRALKACGVNTDHVIRRAGRMGLYFMEEGADLRSGCVIYDRADSAFTALTAAEINWDAALDGATWFHISGITPAISPSTRDLAFASVREAKARGAHISIDLNHRERLWSYGQSATDVMPELTKMADTLIAGRGDCEACLGYAAPGENGSDDWARELAAEAFRRFPNLSNFALTIRASQTAEVHSWRGFLTTRSNSAFSREYDMMNVVDRVGAGDAFSAGLIYGLVPGLWVEDAVNFGAAANCLKHSVIGDANLVTVSEVETLASTSAFGQLRR